MNPRPKHTPKPWKAHDLPPGFKIHPPQAQAYITAGARGEAGNRIIAAVYSVDGAHAIDTANLLAVAPEMFESLRDLLEYAADCAACNDERPACLAAARAVLAKAEPVAEPTLKSGFEEPK